MQLINKKFAILLWLFSAYVIATPLTDQEKLGFIRGSVPGCVSKNVLAQNISQEADRRLIESYCSCHASTVASIATREEMNQVVKGVVPGSFAQKVQQAREQCIKQISN